MTEQVATIVIGQVFVDVVHGLTVAPTVDDISITDHDNLGGRSRWIDTIGAVTFRLNIISADGVWAHEFGWRLLSEMYEPAPGRYGILVSVKNLCLIDLAERILSPPPYLRQSWYLEALNLSQVVFSQLN